MIASLRSLPWRERGQLVWLTFMAIVMEVAVRMVPLPRLARWMRISIGDVSPSRPGGASRRHAEAESRAAPVDRLYRRWPIKGSCLRRSLVLGHVLRDLDPRLLIGVSRASGEVRAHAWIEVDGRPVGREDGEFAPLRHSHSA